MYEKQLVGRRPLYFKYAPPLTGLDDYSDDKLPNRPFREAKPFQRSVYYYWWLFLKEHEGYLECCENGGNGEYAAIHADFGDVRDDDFMGWWKRGGRMLFCVQQEKPVYVYSSANFDLNDEGRVVVSLPISRDVDEVLAELKALLKPLRKHVPLRDSDKRAKYEVAFKPVLTSLHDHWKIRSLRKQHPDAKLYELGDLAGLTVSEKDGADLKQVKAIAVSRYLKQGNRLVEYVGKGIFPVMNTIQIADLKRSGVLS